MFVMNLRPLLLAAIILLSISPAVTAHASSLTEKQIEAAIESYLSRNTGKLLSMIREYERQEEAQQENERMEDLTAAAEHYRKSLLSSRTAATSGSRQPSVVAVHFQDLNCGECMDEQQEIQEILSGQKEVRVLNRYLTNRDEISRKAASYALSMVAVAPGRLIALHDEFYKGRGFLNDRSVADAVERVLDAEELDAMADFWMEESNHEEAERILSINREMAERMKIWRLPTLILFGRRGVEVLPQDAEREELLKTLERLR